MFNPNGQPQYTAEQLLQFANLHQQQQNLQALQANQQNAALFATNPNQLLPTSLAHLPPAIQQQAAQLGVAPHQLAQIGALANPGLAQQQSLAAAQQMNNPFLLNQFLQNQSLQQFQVAQQLEFQQNFQTNFEAIQRLQALTAQHQVAHNAGGMSHGSLSNAMQTDEGDLAFNMLAQHLAVQAAASQQLLHNNVMDTSPGLSGLVQPPLVPSPSLKNVATAFHQPQPVTSFSAVTSPLAQPPPGSSPGPTVLNPDHHPAENSSMPHPPKKQVQTHSKVIFNKPKSHNHQQSSSSTPTNAVTSTSIQSQMEHDDPMLNQPQAAQQLQQVLSAKAAAQAAAQKGGTGAESVVDSALGASSVGSTSPGGHSSGKTSLAASVGGNQSLCNETKINTVQEGLNLTADKFPVLASNPQVHVPCTAKCYHRCKLGLACPRHAHKHLEKMQKKQKQAQEGGSPAEKKTSSCSKKPKDGKLKSIETITSGSCISNSGSSVLSSLHGNKDTNKNSKRTFLDLYEVYTVIGVGGGGMVYSGRRIADKLPVAIKRVMREKVKRWEAVQGYQVPQEIALMLRCYGHVGVIRLVDWYECLDSFILIMERPERAVDLFDYIREVGRVPEKEAARIFKQVLDAAIHVQKCGVVHRDLKDENIIINRDSGEAKIIDFGCGTLLRDTAYRDFSGTPEFYPPEWFTLREYYARTAAVWSLGVLLFDMLQGEIPFKQKEKIVENNPTYKHSISGESKHLIQWLMSTNPADRPNILEISSHPWLVQHLGTDSM